MQIKTVTYRRVYNLGNYESEAIEATAEVMPGETPEQALANLQEWVADKAGANAAQRVAEVRQRPVLGSPVGPTVPAASSNDPMATPAQVNAIFAIGRRELGWNDDDVDTHCRSVFGKPAGELTKREASELIDRMKSNPAGLR